MIRVKLTVGVGLWTAHKEVELAAAPHVGDIITLTGDDSYRADVVFIAPKYVHVRCTRRCTLDEINELKKEGWE